MLYLKKEKTKRTKFIQDSSEVHFTLFFTHSIGHESVNTCKYIFVYRK